MSRFSRAVVTLSFRHEMFFFFFLKRTQISSFSSGLPLCCSCIAVFRGFLSFSLPLFSDHFWRNDFFVFSSSPFMLSREKKQRRGRRKTASTLSSSFSLTVLSSVATNDDDSRKRRGRREGDGLAKERERERRERKRKEEERKRRKRERERESVQARPSVRRSFFGPSPPLLHMTMNAYEEEVFFLATLASPSFLCPFSLFFFLSLFLSLSPLLRCMRTQLGLSNLPL